MEAHGSPNMATCAMKSKSYPRSIIAMLAFVKVPVVPPVLGMSEDPIDNLVAVAGTRLYGTLWK